MPDTAPTAKITAATFDHRCASSNATASPRRMPIHSAISMTVGKATPKQAKMMWKPNDAPICTRAGMSPSARTCSETLTSDPPHAEARMQHGGGGEAHMFSAPLVVLPGLGIGALGRLVPVLYVVGLIMILIGGIGVPRTVG